MTPWLTIKLSGEWTAQHNTIAQTLVERCGVLIKTESKIVETIVDDETTINTTDYFKISGLVIEPQNDGTVEYLLSRKGSGQLSQDDILYLLATEGCEISGRLYAPYYLILPVSAADDPVPIEFPNRTYFDAENVEQVRKVKDYVRYRLSQDGQTALVRCTHKEHHGDPSGVALVPEDFKLWHDVAMATTEHTEVQPNGLIEATQAAVLLAGDYMQL